MKRTTKYETLLRIPRKQLREIANYALEFIEIEREQGYTEATRLRRLQRVERVAKDILAAAKKPRLLPTNSNSRELGRAPVVTSSGDGS